MNGLLGQLPPGLRGFQAQRQFDAQEDRQQLSQATGLLGMRNAVMQANQARQEQELKGLLGQKLSAGDQEGAKALLMQYKPELFVKSLTPQDPKYQDLGGTIGVIQNGKLVGQIPKTATPDAALRESGADRRHAAPSGGALLGAQTTMRGQDITMRGQDMTNSLGRANLGVSQGNLDLNRRRFALDTDPNFQADLAGAKRLAAEQAKVTVDAQSSLPEARSKAAAVSKMINDMIGSQTVVNGKIVPGTVKAHPGFQSFVGSAVPGIDGMAVPGLQYVPGSSASDFKRRHEQITGNVFLEAYQMLKGGGQITEIEGNKAQAAKSRMDSAQSEVEYVNAAREFEQAVMDGVKKLEAKADRRGSPRDSTKRIVVDY